MALSARELQRIVNEAGDLLQQIQDELGPAGEGGRVRFPRGFIQTVGTRRPQFLWFSSAAMAHNICYHLIFGDVLRWLLNRTTLSHAARSMVIKHMLTVMGAVVEALTVAAHQRLRLGPPGKFEPRVNRLVGAGAVTFNTGEEMKWLWRTRTSLHIHEVEGLEHERYNDDDATRAIATYRAVRDEMNAKFM